MNIVKFWSDQVNKWKETDKCNMCWEFSAPLFEDASNIFQNREACCTYVLLTDLTENTVPRYNTQTGFKTAQHTDYSFTVDFVIKGDLGTNNYNEIKDHPIEESRYETIYRPLRECINLNDIDLDFCEFLGYIPENMRWNMSMSRAYLDNNYFGWKLTASFRVNNSDTFKFNK